MAMTDNLHWILSFYRTSEISGALFFGQLANALRPSRIQADMTRHFADEAQHARYWTDCLEKLGVQPLKLGLNYQNQYVSAAGMPVNLMEVLAITQVFEKRVISQYALHALAPPSRPQTGRSAAGGLFRHRSEGERDLPQDGRDEPVRGETQTVQVANGVFHVLLGSVTPPTPV